MLSRNRNLTKQELVYNSAEALPGNRRVATGCLEEINETPQAGAVDHPSIDESIVQYEGDAALIHSDDDSI